MLEVRVLGGKDTGESSRWHPIESRCLEDHGDVEGKMLV